MTDSKDNRIRVKVCGLTSLEDARFAAGALADYLGFIFYEKSPRYLEPAKAGAIINWIEGPETVGVFVNQPLDDVNMIARETGIDLVQLHGNESPDYCQLIDRPVIKVFHVGEGTDAAALNSEIEPYRGVVDYLLFDTKTDQLWGGTGLAFNWNLLNELSQETPFFLSGGLKRANIAGACGTVRPWAVDLSSGLEESPGVKDFDKIEAFFEEMEKINESDS
ncbi:MAG: phosphoribosylanthranilate isomerase [Balneolaceae bacterium]